MRGGVVPVIWRSSSSWVWGASFVGLHVGFGEPGKKKGGKTTTEVEIINTIWFLTKHRRKQTSIFNHCYCRVFRTFARTLDLNVSWSLQNMRSPRSWETEQHAVDPTTVGHKGGTGKLKRGKGGVQLPQLLYVSDGNKFFPVREPSVINATRIWKVDEYTPQPCFLLHSPPYLFYFTLLTTKNHLQW